MKSKRILVVLVATVMVFFTDFMQFRSCIVH